MNPTSRAATVFTVQADRIVKAWRRVRFQERGAKALDEGVLDNVAVAFVQNIGAALAGACNSPWAATRGLLRFSTGDGVAGLTGEIALFRSTLVTALDAVGATASERETVHRAVDEAALGAELMLRQSLGEQLPVAPRFGGVVTVAFRPAARSRTQTVEASPAST